MFRNIQIAAALNGFIVTCGCQTLVFNTSEDLTKALKAYLDDPQGEEKRMLKEGLNAKHTQPGVLAEAEPQRAGICDEAPRGAVLGAGQRLDGARGLREALGMPYGERDCAGDLCDSVGGQPVADERR